MARGSSPPALEHLVYELSTPAGRRRGTAFPIFDDEDDFKRQGEPKIATIRGDERTLIERLQPYNATKVASDNPLAILRKLSNLDKHRLLVTTVAAVSELESGVGSGNARSAPSGPSGLTRSTASRGIPQGSRCREGRVFPTSRSTQPRLSPLSNYDWCQMRRLPAV